MNPMNPKNRFRAALALALALTLALAPAAGAAGLWSWLTGEEAAEASATLAAVKGARYPALASIQLKMPVMMPTIATAMIL